MVYAETRAGRQGPLAVVRRAANRYRGSMSGQANPRRFRIETMGESTGRCDCCGNESRCVWGAVYDGDVAAAVYWMHWATGHLEDPGANLDLILGSWGEGATADQRFAVALLHRQQSDGRPALMVIDAVARPFAQRGLASSALARSDVIGTSLAAHVFALADAIYEQDRRFF